MHAELDPNTYPLGIAISKNELRHLPIHPHDHHGEWNYTIAPTGTTTAPVTASDRTRNRVQALRLLADERITGLSSAELRAPWPTNLPPAQQAQAAQRRFEQRGGPRRRARGAGSTRILTPADAVLITVVYQRQVCSQKVLTELLGISDMPIGLLISETRQLLTENDIQISPATRGSRPLPNCASSQTAIDRCPNDPESHSYWPTPQGPASPPPTWPP